MLIFDFRKIGGKMYSVRKRLGMTQAEVAEASGMSDRAYADIERGTVNMRVETILHICQALGINPDDLLTEYIPKIEVQQEDLFDRLKQCTPQERETALRLLSVYLDSLK